jgi:hypothetical protein
MGEEPGLLGHEMSTRYRAGMATPTPYPITVIEQSDPTQTILNTAAVLVAALIGVGALALVQLLQRHAQRVDASDLAIEALMAALSERATALSEYMNSPVRDAVHQVVVARTPNKDTRGGPADIAVQTQADVTLMKATKKRRAVLKAVAETLFHFKRALVTWQVSRLGEVVGDLRKWQTGDLSDSEMIEAMKLMKQQIESSETAARR